MSLRLYLTGIIFTTFISFAAVFLILNYFTPDGADTLLFILLFLSSFIFLAGLFCLISFLFMKKGREEQFLMRSLGDSFRRGMLLALLLTGSLVLRAFFSFFWLWGSIFLLIAVLAMEFFFSARE